MALSFNAKQFRKSVIYQTIALLDRAADPDQLDFFLARYDKKNISTTQVFNMLANTQEARDLHPFLDNYFQGMVNTAQAKSFFTDYYMTGSDRPPNATEMKFWITRLTEKSTDLASALIISLQTRDRFQDAQTVLNNKFKVALDFYKTAKADPNFEKDLVATAAAASILAEVTSDPKTVEDGKDKTAAYFQFLHFTSFGDETDNTLTGYPDDERFDGRGGDDTITGLGGDDLLYGRDGKDNLDGRRDDDVIYGGADNDQLQGGGGRDRLFGGAGKDYMLAGHDNKGLPDILDGGTGADTMIGQSGSTVFYVDNPGDTVHDYPLNKAEKDEVRSTISFDLGDSVAVVSGDIENLTLLGRRDINATGNELDNVVKGNVGANVISGLAGHDMLSGSDGNDKLLGGAGDDTLTGGRGLDILRGGTGNDTYVAVEGKEKPIEKANEGTDTVTASVTHYLGDHLENLNLLGSKDINGRGNGLANRIDGNAGDNLLFGAGGKDILNGGLGNDTLGGGKGPDIFEFTASRKIASGKDTIKGFAAKNNLEKIDLSAVDSVKGFNDLKANHLSQKGANAVLDLKGGNTISLQGVDKGDLDAADFLF